MVSRTIENKHLPAPGAVNLSYVEGLYEDYLRAPASVPPDWQRYFAEVADGELRSGILGDFGFKTLHFFMQDKTLGSHYFSHGALNFSPRFFILKRKIDEWDRHRASRDR